MMRRAAVLVALMVLADPAVAQQRKGGRCIGDAIDSTTMAMAPVYGDCDVDRTAKASNTIRPAFQPDQYCASSSCFRTELEFVVDTSGHPEMGIVKVFSTNSNELTEAVKLVLPGLRYEPALRDGKPVRQLVRYRSSVSTVTYVTSSPGSSGPPSSMRRPNC